MRKSQFGGLGRSGYQRPNTIDFQRYFLCSAQIRWSIWMVHQSIILADWIGSLSRVNS